MFSSLFLPFHSLSAIIYRLISVVSKEEVETWQSATKKLSEFFRFFLASKNYVLVTEKDLYEAFKQYWKEKNTDGSESILEDLLNYAPHFERLYLSVKSDELGENIGDFRQMQSYMPAPFVMRILDIIMLEELTKNRRVLSSS